MNKTLLTAVAFAAVLSAAPAGAQSRPDSLTMTCDAAQALIRKSGQVVMGTGPLVYDRYVANARFCTQTQMTKNAFIATKDNKYCLVGYYCRERSLFWEN